MTDDYSIIRATQAEMKAAAKACEVPFDLDHLGALIRLMELFNADICEGTLFAARRMPVYRWCDAVFAGVTSFWSIRSSATMLSNVELSVRSGMTIEQVVAAFQACYQKFHSEGTFEQRLLLLLELFKLQILWAAMNYR